MKETKDYGLDAMLKELELYENPATEKQKQILKAAEKVFGERGYEGAPTAEIAREAGVTERTLFKHFKTKSALLKRVVFAFVVKTLLPAQIKRVNEIAQTEHATVGDLMRTIALDRLAVIRKHGMGPKIVLGEVLQNEPFREQVKTIWREQVWVNVVSAIKRFQDRGSVRKDIRPEAIARVMVTSIVGYVFLRAILTSKEKWDDEKEIADIIRVVTEGMSPR